MQDFLKVKVVEVTVDNTGKLWINIDGKCELRVAHCEIVITDNHQYGREEVNFIEET